MLSESMAMHGISAAAVVFDYSGEVVDVVMNAGCSQTDMLFSNRPCAEDQ